MRALSNVSQETDHTVHFIVAHFNIPICIPLKETVVILLVGALLIQLVVVHMLILHQQTRVLVMELMVYHGLHMVVGIIMMIQSILQVPAMDMTTLKTDILPRLKRIV